MAIFSESKRIELIISNVLGDRKDIKVKIHFSDNMYMDALKYCKNSEYLKFLETFPAERKAEANKLNGLYLYPEDLTEIQPILVSETQRNDGCSHFSTIAHEVQHAKNNTVFCEKYCMGKINDIADSHYYSSFQIWDEFAARRTGHRIYLKLVLREMNHYSKARVKDLIQSEEIPARLDEIRILLNQEKNNEMYKRLCEKMAFFNVWKTEYDIEIEPYLDAWTIELYSCLTKYDSIEQVDFNELDNELGKLWHSMPSKQ